jgi:hypothetical protein
LGDDSSFGEDDDFGGWLPPEGEGFLGLDRRVVTMTKQFNFRWANTEKLQGREIHKMERIFHLV